MTTWTSMKQHLQLRDTCSGVILFTNRSTEEMWISRVHSTQSDLNFKPLQHCGVELVLLC